MIKTAIQLKAKIRNLSNGDNDTARAMLRIFFMERFLERLSESDYRDSFMLKGGMLTASLIGINLRATMDIDATIIALPVNEAEISKVVEEICRVQIDDGVSFETNKISEIMDDFEYPGLRINLTGYLDKLRQPFKIDISTDDAITPRAIEYGYSLMFEDRNILLNSYNVETLLAEKTQTIVSRGLANTRMRDFYDVYEITNHQDYSKELFFKAFQATCRKRSCSWSTDEIQKELDIIKADSDMEKDGMNSAEKIITLKELIGMRCLMQWTEC